MLIGRKEWSDPVDNLKIARKNRNIFLTRKDSCNIIHKSVIVN